MSPDSVTALEPRMAAPQVAPAGGIEDEPAFESRGIDYIPLRDRRGRPADLGWMWAGALFNVEYVVYGALLVVATGFGLRFWQAALIIIVGNLSYLITGLGSLQGPRAGTAAFTINRAPFGPLGAKLIAVFNWMTQVGYEVLGLALVVYAGLALLGKAGVGSSTGLKIVLIVVAALIQMILPLFGHRAMMRTLRALVPPFIVLFILLAILALPKAHLGAGHNASWAMMMAGLAFVLSAGGYGWPMNANDFSRYLSPTTSRTGIIGWVALGGFIPTTLLMLLGAAVATAVPAASDPISGLPHAFASWFIWPYLVFAIVQLFAINSIDLYSSGLTLQAIIPTIKRWQCVLIDTTVAGALTAYTVFSSGFNNFIHDFVLFMLIWIAPWVAIYLIDYFLRRGRYDSRALLTTNAGIYFRNGGVHVAGIVAQLVGMVAAASWLNAYPAWIAPLSKATNDADFSVFMGALFGGVIYYLLARRGVRAEAEQAPEPEVEAIAAT